MRPRYEDMHQQKKNKKKQRRTKQKTNTAIGSLTYKNSFRNFNSDSQVAGFLAGHINLPNYTVTVGRGIMRPCPLFWASTRSHLANNDQP